MMLSVRCPVRAPASRPRAATVSAPKPCKALRAVVVRATDDKNPLSNIGDALKNAAEDAKEAVDKVGDKIAEGAEAVKEVGPGQVKESANYDNKQAQREQLYGSSNAGAEEKLGGAAKKHTSRSGADRTQQTGGGP